MTFTETRWNYSVQFDFVAVPVELYDLNVPCTDIIILIRKHLKTFQNFKESSKNVKCTLVQALRLCTGRTAHSRSRGIVLPFHDHGTRRGEGSASRPIRTLLPWKARYPFYRGLDGPQGRSGQVRKISPLPGFDPRTVQAVASRNKAVSRPKKKWDTYRILYVYVILK